MKHLTKEQISDLIHESLIEHAVLRNHLDSCESCKTKYTRSKTIHLELQKLEYQRPSMRFAKNIIERIEAKIKLDKSKMFWVRSLGFSLIASLSLIIVIMISLGTSEDSSSTNSLSSIYSWSLILLNIAFCSWILYFLDIWFAKKAG
jgi:predicted anti-sigma-YlaC factor YlaD